VAASPLGTVVFSQPHRCGAAPWQRTATLRCANDPPRTPFPPRPIPGP